MEFIKTPTIKNMELTKADKEKIITALNSYMKLSFWALFNDKEIVFHGDPHAGNISIDEDGNICFLDMGLLCALSEEDAKLCRKFFLTAYSGNYEKMYNTFVSYGEMTEEQKHSFKIDCKKYCENIKEKEVTNYFIDMVNVCLKYEFVPPNFLFNMAKAFVCLNGISNFSNNNISARDLLQEQTIEFLIKRSIDDGKEIVKGSVYLTPKLLENTLQYGLTNTIAKTITNVDRNAYKEYLENIKETITLITISLCDEVQVDIKKKNK